MKQINLNVTEEFERDLRQYMKRKGLATKSDAIRQAMREAVSRRTGPSSFDFRSLLGAGLRVPPRRRARPLTEDDLWS
jgi:Arc/MetJ-type ribon-helix-helix transcriptional regulator